MSRWLPESLHITLAPDRLTIGRSAHRLDFKARRRLPAAANVIPVPAGDAAAPPWRSALATLEQVIGDMDGHVRRYAGATLVLSNHFVRYALMPWSDLLNDDAEESALSRHCLGQAFGTAAERWELRVAPEPQGATKLVSAVEPDLLAEARDLFARAGIRLVSIQPRLMDVCNRHGHRLGQRDAWLALVEPGALCLALLQGGNIVRLRHLRLGNPWPAELVIALERESYLAESEVATRDVFLAAATAVVPRFPPDLAWNIRLLEPIATADVAPIGSAGLAAAPGG